MKPLLIAIALLESAALAWCLSTRQPEEERYCMPDPPPNRVALERAKPVTLRIEVDGATRVLHAYDCKVFVETPQGHEEVLDGEWAFFASCSSQDLKREGKYLKAEISRFAFGAGGPSTSTYRSLDGIHWELRTDQGWRAK